MDADLAAFAEARRPSVASVRQEKGVFTTTQSTENSSVVDEEDDGVVGGVEPTQEELQTLRRVTGPISWQAMTVTAVEFCERFSYYGTTAIFVNFIQQPRPYGSRTGAMNMSQACIDATSAEACAQAGGLGQGQQASTGLVRFNQFWACKSTSLHRLSIPDNATDHA